MKAHPTGSRKILFIVFLMTLLLLAVTIAHITSPPTPSVREYMALGYLDMLPTTWKQACEEGVSDSFGFNSALFIVFDSNETLGDARVQATQWCDSADQHLPHDDYQVTGLSPWRYKVDWAPCGWGEGGLLVDERIITCTAPLKLPGASDISFVFSSDGRRFVEVIIQP